MKKAFWIVGGFVVIGILALLLIVAGLLFLLPLGETTRPATIVEVVNQVDACPRPEDAWRAATVDMAIYGGGHVRTGTESGGLLSLQEGTVRLSADTLCTVKESNSRWGTLVTTLRLQRGRLWADLADGAHDFRVETDGAVAAVRDTLFSVRVTDGETLVSVAQGSVEVTAQKRVVSVHAGQQTTVLAGHPPSPAEPMSDDERRVWATEGRVPEMAPPTPTVTSTPVPTATPTVTHVPTPIPIAGAWVVDVDWDDSDPSSFELTFGEDGRITYIDEGTTFGGAWTLEGNEIRFDINDYSFWEGVVQGDDMTGTCTNRGDLTGTWSASRR